MGLVKRLVRNISHDNRGSISILILGLFLLTVTTLIILTDISSVYLGKRVLTQATEAAAQRGVRNLDLEKYYATQYDTARFAINFFGEGEKDPGIPIDCAKGEADAISALSDWRRLGNLVTRSNVGSIRIEEISCNGFELGVMTSARVKLPFQLAFIGIKEVDITSKVGIFDERKITTNYYGLNLG